MLPRLTRRRMFGGVLLLLGTLFLAIGTWQQSPPFLAWGLACWIAASLGLGVLMVQRANAVMRVAAFHQSDIQKLIAANDKATGLLGQLNPLQDVQAKELKRQVGELGRVSSSLDALRKQLSADQSSAAIWRRDQFEHLVTFRRQFGDFVGSVAEWIALAEAEAKQGLTRLSEEGTSSRHLLQQRLGGVERAIAEARRATELVPQAIAATGLEMGTMSQSLHAAIAEVSEATTIEHSKLLEALQARLDAVNDAVLSMQQTSKQMNKTAAAESEQIKTISKTVKLIIPTQRNEISRARVEAVKQLEAILQLQAVLAPDNLRPLLGGWAMEPVSMLGVVTELLARKPEVVLECGSGTSTLWIAMAFRHIGKGRVVSLEHLEEHHAATSRAVLAAGLERWVDLRLAPLRVERIGKEEFNWYDLECVDLPKHSVDFLVIDGPPGATGPLARYPALPLLERVLADHAVIVLDDVDRPDEVEEVVRWLEEYPAFHEVGELGARTRMFKYSRPGTSEKRNSMHLKAL